MLFCQTLNKPSKDYHTGDYFAKSKITSHNCQNYEDFGLTDRE